MPIICFNFVFAAHSAVVLKAESLADKTEWLEKLKNVVESKGGQVKVESAAPPMRQSLSDGSLVSYSLVPIGFFYLVLVLLLCLGCLRCLVLLY